MLAAPPGLRRRNLAWRYGLAVLTAGLQVSSVVQAALRHEWGAWGGLVVAWNMLWVFAGVWLMRQRRRHPLRTSVLQSLSVALTGSVLFAPDWALASLATRRRMREVVPAAVVFLLCRDLAVINPLAEGGTDLDDPLMHLVLLVITLLEMALLVMIGFYAGARRDLLASLREQVQQAERAQELAALHARAEERNRIAREMHDVVAHRISLVALHAGALAYRDDLDPERTREIAATIQQNASASLTELRSVLGQLRSVPDPASGMVLPERPQPTLNDVDGLVRDARAAGMQIDFRNGIEHPELLSPQTGRHMFRIVQESLTNARKHAQGARVRASITGSPGSGLRLVVRNGLRPGAALLPGSGVGLVGVHERAQMLGGWSRAGVLDDPTGEWPAGCFELEVWLPW